MDDWRGDSGDQYYSMVDTKYPAFNTMSTPDYYMAPRNIGPVEARLQVEQQGAPFYMKRDCTQCRGLAVRPPMERQTIDERSLHVYKCPQDTVVPKKAKIDTTIRAAQLERVAEINPVFNIWLFILVFVVFIAGYGVSTLVNLISDVRSLKSAMNTAAH